MEQLLSEIGVVKNDANEIAETFLQSKHYVSNVFDNENSEGSRLFTSAGAIAQSIIENEVPELLHFPEEGKGRAEIKVVNLHSVNSLYKRRKRTLEDLNNSLVDVRSRIPRRVSWCCPNCDEYFSIVGEENLKVFKEQHLKRCCDQSDSEDRGIYSSESDSLLPSGKEPFSRSSEQRSFIDDWEEEDFRERVGNLDSSELDKFETSFASTVVSKSWTKLYDYQKEGCRWLYSLYLEGLGGILADEMGKSLA